MVRSKVRGLQEPHPLTDERGDDVVHALQEAGEVLCGRVVRRGDLSHDRRCLGPGCFHAAFIGQDVRQAQDPINLHITQHTGHIRYHKVTGDTLKLLVTDGQCISEITIIIKDMTCNFYLLIRAAQVTTHSLQ